MKTPINSINSSLANACQLTQASCCKAGLLFLPEQEYQAIVQWLAGNSASELGEFESRCVKYDGFYLYDQKDNCQFLTETNLCRLHPEGVKPSECFWWPVHIYGTEPENLELCVATKCCTACEYIDANSYLLDDITKRAHELGCDVICRFRRVYLGSYEKRFLRKL
ncbi:hypothetical protein [Scytonema sp. PCC 10023]|uniref:hypothetical protein n=1 Tax=Scytonema sp. PCC 10023 TaxID=1680591 RepID=UPI0039C64347